MLTLPPKLQQGERGRDEWSLFARRGILIARIDKCPLKKLMLLANRGQRADGALTALFVQ